MDVLVQYLNDEVEKSINIIINNARKNITTKTKKQHLLWHMIHLLTFAYPDNPTDQDRIIFADFFVMHLKDCIHTCGGCKINYEKKIKETDLNSVFSSKEKLMNYFIEMHNEITINKNKNIPDAIIKTYSYNEVFDFYTKNDFQKYFKDSFDFDIFDLLYRTEYREIVTKFNKLI